MNSITLLEVEDEVGLILPGEIIARYNLKVDDGLKLIETKERFQLRPAATTSKAE